MHINAAGLELVKRFEECRLVAYKDDAGVPTIGWGHTRGVKMGDTCTQEQADAWLEEDMAEAEALVGNVVTIELHSNQFSALASLAFNVGPGKEGKKDGIVVLKNGKPSALLTKLNAGDFDGAADEFAKWRKVGGKVSAGLVRRRQAEEELFRRDVKPLSQSRTIQTGSVATGSAIGLGAISEAANQLSPAVSFVHDLHDWWPAAALVVALVGIGVMVWWRFQDHLAGNH